MREDFADITYTADGRSTMTCPCGNRRLLQCDGRGDPLGIFDRTCALVVCETCGRIMTADGAVIRRREVEAA